MLTSTNFANDIGLWLIDSYGINQLYNKLKPSPDSIGYIDAKHFFVSFSLSPSNGMQIVLENIYIHQMPKSPLLWAQRWSITLHELVVAKSFLLRLILFVYEFIEGYPDISVNVNVSSHQLCLWFMAIVWQQRTIDFIMEKLSRWSFPFSLHHTDIDTHRHTEPRFN